MKKNTGISPAALGALFKGDLENALVASTPGGIEAQEKQGQIDQSFAETLPIDLGGRIADFEKAGFIFGKPADNLFVNVKFPDGWRKRVTEHSMHTDIIDSKGRKRGGIFYKAAFYDQRADAHLSCRFGVGSDHGEPTATISVRDACKKVDKKLTGFKVPDYSGDREEANRRYDAQQSAIKELQMWLDAEYPDWKSPLAYWTK